MTQERNAIKQRIKRKQEKTDAKRPTKLAQKKTAKKNASTVDKSNSKKKNKVVSNTSQVGSAAKKKNPSKKQSSKRKKPLAEKTSKTARKKHHKKKLVNVKSKTSRFDYLKKKVQSKSFKRDLRDLLLVFGGTLLVALIVSSFFFTITKVNGYSMSPTLRDAETIFVQKTDDINRRDIIVFERGNSQDVRRVIGLPGDRIEYVDDVLYVNGNIIDEPYIIEHINEAQRNGGNYTEDFNMQALTGEAFVPENSYFVLGDNREWSRDSREYGFIPANQLIGVVKMRLLPLNNLASFTVTNFPVNH